jgi:thymidylate synthase
MSRHPEHQYLDLLRELLAAPPHPTRNDTAARSVFARQMRFDLERHGFPLLTTKETWFKGIAAELIWFLSGSTNAKVLEDQGVNIWRKWGDPETRDLGPVYGAQWRRWVGDRISSQHRERIDQIANVLDSLRTDPHGRRHIVSAWNPVDIPDMALPPCHCLFQFNVGADERLNLQLYQRSADTFLGVPFNIASYALLLEMFAAVLGRRAGELIWTGGDVHLYSNHVEQAQQQILREPKPFPRLRILPKPDMDQWRLCDFRIDGYEPWPHIPAEASA